MPKTDVVTALEVLEHLKHPEQAARLAAKTARQWVIASVPSKEDNNPQHINLFSQDSLTELLTHAGAKRVSISYVRGHMLALAKVT